MRVGLAILRSQLNCISQFWITAQIVSISAFQSTVAIIFRLVNITRTKTKRGKD